MEHPIVQGRHSIGLVAQASTRLAERGLGASLFQALNRHSKRLKRTRDRLVDDGDSVYNRERVDIKAEICHASASLNMTE
jgi:hypothetical protein